MINSQSGLFWVRDITFFQNVPKTKLGRTDEHPYFNISMQIHKEKQWLLMVG